MNKTEVILAILFYAAVSRAADIPFSRYQLIIDKEPFGSEPAGPEIVQIDPSKSFARTLRLSMLFLGPDGETRVGIVDSSNKKGSSSYILSIGENESGIELVEASINQSYALLRKGNEEARLELSSGTTETEQTPTKKTSYSARRRALLQKIEARKKAAEKEERQPQLTGEALKKHLEQVQMNAIREGLPPLPMPLTPEMDATLVEEGVLPPQ